MGDLIGKIPYWFSPAVGSSKPRCTLASGIHVFHLRQQFVFLHAALSLLAHGQQNWMLFVAWSNAVDHSFTLQKIFLAQQGVGLLVGRVGADPSLTTLLPLSSSTPHSQASIWSNMSD